MADMNVNVTTQESLSPEMKKYYDKVLLEEAKPNLIHNQFAQKRPIPKGNGKTIEFRKFTSLPKALTPLTEGVTPDGKSLAVTSLEATVSQYGDYVCLSDLISMTAIDPIVVEATKAVGNQAGLTLDTITRDIMNSGTNVSYAPTISGSTETEVSTRAALDGTSKMTVALLEKCRAKLRNANVPLSMVSTLLLCIHQ